MSDESKDPQDARSRVSLPDSCFSFSFYPLSSSSELGFPAPPLSPRSLQLHHTAELDALRIQIASSNQNPILHTNSTSSSTPFFSPPEPNFIDTQIESEFHRLRRHYHRRFSSLKSKNHLLHQQCEFQSSLAATVQKQYSQISQDFQQQYEQLQQLQMTLTQQQQMIERLKKELLDLEMKDRTNETELKKEMNRAREQKEANLRQIMSYKQQLVIAGDTSKSATETLEILKKEHAAVRLDTSTRIAMLEAQLKTFLSLPQQLEQLQKSHLKLEEETIHLRLIKEQSIPLKLQYEENQLKLKEMKEKEVKWEEEKKMWWKEKKEWEEFKNGKWKEEESQKMKEREEREILQQQWRMEKQEMEEEWRRKWEKQEEKYREREKELMKELQNHRAPADQNLIERLNEMIEKLTMKNQELTEQKKEIKGNGTTTTTITAEKWNFLEMEKKEKELENQKLKEKLEEINLAIKEKEREKEKKERENEKKEIEEWKEKQKIENELKLEKEKNREEKEQQQKINNRQQQAMDRLLLKLEQLQSQYRQQLHFQEWKAESRIQKLQSELQHQQQLQHIQIQQQQQQQQQQFQDLAFRALPSPSPSPSLSSSSSSSSAAAAAASPDSSINFQELLSKQQQLDRDQRVIEAAKQKQEIIEAIDKRIQQLEASRPISPAPVAVEIKTTTSDSVHSQVSKMIEMETTGAQTSQRNRDDDSQSKPMEADAASVSSHLASSSRPHRHRHRHEHHHSGRSRSHSNHHHRHHHHHPPHHCHHCGNHHSSCPHHSHPDSLHPPPSCDQRNHEPRSQSVEPASTSVSSPAITSSSASIVPVSLLPSSSDRDRERRSPLSPSMLVNRMSPDPVRSTSMSKQVGWNDEEEKERGVNGKVNIASPSRSESRPNALLSPTTRLLHRLADGFPKSPSLPSNLNLKAPDDSTSSVSHSTVFPVAVSAPAPVPIPNLSELYQENERMGAGLNTILTQLKGWAEQKDIKEANAARRSQSSRDPHTDTNSHLSNADDEEISAWRNRSDDGLGDSSQDDQSHFGSAGSAAHAVTGWQAFEIQNDRISSLENELSIQQEEHSEAREFMERQREIKAKTELRRMKKKKEEQVREEMKRREPLKVIPKMREQRQTATTAASTTKTNKSDTPTGLDRLKK